MQAGRGSAWKFCHGVHGVHGVHGGHDDGHEKAREGAEKLRVNVAVRSWKIFAEVGGGAQMDCWNSSGDTLREIGDRGFLGGWWLARWTWVGG